MMINGNKKKIDFLNPQNNNIMINLYKDKSPLNTKMNKTDLCKRCLIKPEMGQGYCKNCLGESIVKGFGRFEIDAETGVKCWIASFKNNDKNISSNNKTMDQFKKFNLLELSKSPSNEWSQKANSNRQKLWKKDKKISNNIGLGIPTGKINDIFVLDLDFYKWKEDHEFIKAFGEPKDYPKIFDTYSQKSAGGGMHFFFKYDPRFYNIINHTYEIDILSDINQYGDYKGKYVVGAGTTIRFNAKDKEKYKTSADYGTYEILNDKPIKAPDQKLIDWMLKYLYEPDKKSIKISKGSKTQTIKSQKNIFKYRITDKKAEMICNKLYMKDKSYFTQYQNWLIFTTAFKTIDKYDIWDQMNKKYGGSKYDLNKNKITWNGITDHNNLKCINHILLKIDERTFLDYIKYKPIYQKDIIFDEILENADKLGKHMQISTHKDYAIMSGTGTGKTTIAKKYFRDNDLKFLSIVSRRTLAYEQFKIFDAYGLDAKWYEHYEGLFIPKHLDLIIQIDSIKKISHYADEIGDYVIMLDEYSSLIEHLFRSPTIKDRAYTFRIFKKLISGAKQIICLDADLNQHTLDLMGLCGRDLYKMKNTFNHNKGVPAKEFFNMEDYIKDLKSKDKFLLCTDTARGGRALFKEHFCKEEISSYENNEIEINGEIMNKYDISIGKDDKGFVIFISAENDYMPDLDKWDRVIFSPKIVYGLDSTMEREVYAMYKEHTISPTGMHQQIARCRNIKQLNYIFFNKSFRDPQYISIKDVEDQNKRLLDINDWMELLDIEDIDYYMKTLSIMIFNEDAYKTNKFCHFINILIDRGFKRIDNAIIQTKKKEIEALVKKDKETSIKDFDENNKNHKKINDMLCIPKKEMKDYAHLFIDQNELSKYMAVRSYITKKSSSIDAYMKELEEFKINKIKSSRFKLLFMMQLLEKVTDGSKINFTISKGVPPGDAEQIWNKMDELFRFRFKEDKPDIKTPEGLMTIISKMMTQLMGSSIKKRYYPTEEQIKSGNDKMLFTKINLFETKRKQIGGQRKTYYKINPQYFSSYHKLFKYAYPDIKDFDDYDFGFDKDKHDNHILSNISFLDDGILSGDEEWEA
jgi:hypothetical protein